MDLWGLIVGTGIGVGVALFINYCTQRSSLSSTAHSAKTIIEQAQLRAKLLDQKAQSEQGAKQALFESREKSALELLEDQEQKLLNNEESLLLQEKNLAELRKLFTLEQEQREIHIDNYQKTELMQIEALEKTAKFSGSELWQKHLKHYCTTEESVQQQRLEKSLLVMEDHIEDKAKAIMNVIHQRYNGESTRDPTLIEIEFTAKEFERIIGDEQMSKIIHLQKSLGSELKLEYSADYRVRVFGYDLWRRYIIKGALERMKKNTKLHLEQALLETQKFTEQRMLRIGKKACDYLGIKDFPPELMKLVGRLDYRTSFGQNIYRHSIEVAVLGRMFAEELGCDPYICIVGGLLHDIGKGIDADIAGAHDAIGRDIALEYHLHPDIVHSIFAHHEIEPYRSVEARVVQLADAISAARPGARHHEPLEEYLARMKTLEEAALNQDGVEKAFVMQAGREIRAFVDAQKTDDQKAQEIAQNIVAAVQVSDAVRSGEVKIQVIRELDVFAYAGIKRKSTSYKAKR
ncbi:MAG: HD domain-containing protein [Candidatus Abawacabacteria bacterium]|nr:HD domain-containing protein [Candidatus Abawacabacteria bacterium]